MYLQVVRRNPASDWNPYIYHHWIIGKFTERQLKWIEKFSHRTRRGILGDLALKWVMNGCLFVLALFALQVSIPLALSVAGIVTVMGFTIHQRFALRAWKYAASCIRNRELVVRESDASWSAVRGAIAGRILSHFESYEVSALDDFFRSVTEHDKLRRNRKLEWDDEKRIEFDLAVKVKVLAEELHHRRELHRVMPATRAEYADKAAIFDKVVAEEQRQELHERVSLVLNQPL